MIAILPLPSLEKARKQAFEVAKSQTDTSDVIIYPITEFIGAVYSAKEREPNIVFAKMIKVLYERQERNFIALWLDRYERKVFAFIRDADEFETFMFNEEDALGGIVTILTNYYKKGTSVIALKDEDLKKIVEEGIVLANEARKRQHKEEIPNDSVIWAEGSVGPEDYQSLLRRKTLFDTVMRRLSELYGKMVRPRKRKELIEQEEEEAVNQNGIRPTTIVLVAIAIGLGVFYYYDTFKKQAQEIVVSDKELQREMARFKERNRKNNLRAVELMNQFFGSGMEGEVVIRDGRYRLIVRSKKFSDIPAAVKIVDGDSAILSGTLEQGIKAFGVHVAEKKPAKRKCPKDFGALVRNSGMEESFVIQSKDGVLLYITADANKTMELLRSVSNCGMYSYDFDAVVLPGGEVSTIVTGKRLQFDRSKLKKSILERKTKQSEGEIAKGSIGKM